jgi:hypothetical protein
MRDPSTRKKPIDAHTHVTLADRFTWDPMEEKCRVPKPLKLPRRRSAFHDRFAPISQHCRG